MVTPLMVEIALHYYVNSVTDFPRLNAPAVQLAMSVFMEHGLLEECDDGPQYQGTEGLTTWINALCSVPFPVQQWVIPEKA
jgi:hypothetical protein